MVSSEFLAEVRNARRDRESRIRRIMEHESEGLTREIPSATSIIAQVDTTTTSAEPRLYNASATVQDTTPVALPSTYSGASSMWNVQGSEAQRLRSTLVRLQSTTAELRERLNQLTPYVPASQRTNVASYLPSSASPDVDLRPTALRSASGQLVDATTRQMQNSSGRVRLELTQSLLWQLMDLIFNDRPEPVQPLGPPALSEEEFAKLDTVPHQATDHHQECAICWNSFDPWERKPELLCGHACFHTKCIKAWLTGDNPTCPLCRQMCREEGAKPLEPSSSSSAAGRSPGGAREGHGGVQRMAVSDAARSMQATAETFNLHTQDSGAYSALASLMRWQSQANHTDLARRVHEREAYGPERTSNAMLSGRGSAGTLTTSSSSASTSTTSSSPGSIQDFYPSGHSNSLQVHSIPSDHSHYESTHSLSPSTASAPVTRYTVNLNRIGEARATDAGASTRSGSNLRLAGGGSGGGSRSDLGGGSSSSSQARAHSGREDPQRSSGVGVSGIRERVRENLERSREIREQEMEVFRMQPEVRDVRERIQRVRSSRARGEHSEQSNGYLSRMMPLQLGGGANGETEDKREEEAGDRSVGNANSSSSQSRRSINREMEVSGTAAQPLRYRNASNNARDANRSEPVNEQRLRQRIVLSDGQRVDAGGVPRRGIVTSTRAQTDAMSRRVERESVRQLRRRASQG